MSTTLVNKVIAKAGGIPSLAKDLGISYQAIQQWRDCGYIPPKRHYLIHKKYKISLDELGKSLPAQ